MAEKYDLSLMKKPSIGLLCPVEMKKIFEMQLLH